MSAETFDTQVSFLAGLSRVFSQVGSPTSTSSLVVPPSNTVHFLIVAAHGDERSGEPSVLHPDGTHAQIDLGVLLSTVTSLGLPRLVIYLGACWGAYQYAAKLDGVFKQHDNITFVAPTVQVRHRDAVRLQSALIDVMKGHLTTWSDRALCSAVLKTNNRLARVYDGQPAFQYIHRTCWAPRMGSLNLALPYKRLSRAAVSDVRVIDGRRRVLLATAQGEFLVDEVCLESTLSVAPGGGLVGRKIRIERCQVQRPPQNGAPGKLHVIDARLL